MWLCMLFISLGIGDVENCVEEHFLVNCVIVFVIDEGLAFPFTGLHDVDYGMSLRCELGCMPCSESFPCEAITTKAQPAGLFFDHTHDLLWRIAEEGLTVPSSRECDFEFAWQATESSALLATTRVWSLHERATRSVLALEKPKVCFAIAVDP